MTSDPRVSMPGPATAVRRTWPLRVLVATWVLLLAGSMLLVFLLHATREAEQEAWQQAQELAAAEAARITVVAERLVSEEPSVVTEVLVHSVLRGDIQVALVTDPQLQVVASTRASDLRRPLHQAHPAMHGLLGQHGIGEQLQLFEDRQAGVLRAVRTLEWPAAAGELRGRARGAVWLHLDVAQALRETRARAVKSHLEDSAVLLLFAALLLIGLDRLLLRPVAQLRAYAESIGEGRDAPELAPGRVREIDELGQALQRSAQELRTSLQRLIESEQRFRGLTESAPDAIITLDAQGRVDQFNQAAERLFGFSAADMRGQTLERLLPEGQHAHHTQHVLGFGREAEGASRRMQSGRLVSGRHRDGHTLHLEVGISRSRIGEQVHFTAVVRDVSDRVSVEAELESHRRGLEELVRRRTQELVLESDRAQAATRAKNEFLARIGHELRTPMNTVLGMAHLLRQQVAGEAAPRLQALESAARQLHVLLEDILDFTRLEAGQLALAPAETDLRATVAAAVASLPPNRRSANVELVLWVDADVPERVEVDGLRLRQVLLHLLDNALKFTPSGHVTLRVARESSSAGAEVGLRFEVSDSGIGIPAEDLSQLFQPFEQLNRGDARTHGGAGIGLVICQRVLALMGSELRAQSQKGRGSRFSFSLGGLRVAPSPEEASPRLTGRALVVDALPEARAAQAEALRSLGLITDTVDGPLSALRVMRAALQRGEPVDWVLVGGSAPAPLLRLPAEAAAQGLVPAARWVLAVHEHQALALSDVLRCGYLGTVDKPVTAAVLAERLPAWAGSRGEAPPAETQVPARRAADPRLPGLDDVPGLDIARGLQSLRGNAAAYRRLLHSFATFHAPDPQHLRQAAQAADRAAWRNCAHSLKSAAGAVGAHRVVALAQTLSGPVSPAAPGDAGESQVVLELAGELQQLLDELARRGIGAATSAPQVSAGGAPVAASTLRDALRESLSRRDMAALRSLQSLSDGQLATLGVVPGALRQAVLAFDYDAALDMLAQGEGASS